MPEETIDIEAPGADEAALRAALIDLDGFAHDPDTSNFPAGIFGYKGGRTRTDTNVFDVVAGTLDVSGEADGEVFLWLYHSDGAPTGTSEVNTPPWSYRIWELDVLDGAIVGMTDLRASVHASLALDPGNLLLSREHTGPTPFTDSPKYHSYRVSSGGSEGDEYFGLNTPDDKKQVGQYVFVTFEYRTHEDDRIIFELTALSRGNDTLTRVSLNQTDDCILLQFLPRDDPSNNGTSLEILYASPGVVIATPGAATEDVLVPGVGTLSFVLGKFVSFTPA